MRHLRATVLTLALGPSALVGCGGAAGEAVRPADHTAAGALGKAAEKCTGPSKSAKPLIVDLDQDARAELEAAMKKGVAVVAYDCASLRVVSTCKVADGKYEYAGVGLKEQVLQLTSADDVAANLPINAAKVGASVSSGRSIDLALVRVGTTSTTLGKVARADLVGSCDGATHIVQGATLGAFAMATGSAGKAAAVADMFGYGVDAKSSSERKAMSKDGSLDECRKSDPDAPKPPTQCRAPLQIELTPLVAEAEAAPKAEKGKPKAKTDDKGKDKAAPTIENPCPDGFSFADGLCTRQAAQAKLCAPKDEAGCKAECDKGSFESCFNYGNVIKKDKGRSIPVFLKACNGGVPDACGALANAMMPDDESPTAPADAKKAVKYALQGCKDGGPFACEIVGDYFLLFADEYKLGSPVTGLKAYERGCSLGNATACSLAAYEILRGKRVTREVPRALALFERACQGGSPSECDDLGRLYETGKSFGNTDGLSIDLEKALSYYKKACSRDANWCLDAAKVAGQLGKAEESYRLAVRSCGSRDSEACLLAAVAHETGKGAPKDADKAKALFTKACDNGEGEKDACKKIGVKMKY